MRVRHEIPRAALLGLALLAATLRSGRRRRRAVQFGIQDDAWLEFGPGRLSDRVAELSRLGLDAVRVTLRWDHVERTQGDYDWNRPDKLLAALHAHGLEPVVTLWGTPGWANDDAGPNVAPSDGCGLRGVRAEAALRYRYVTRWVVWNEPNKPIWLKPASPETYVQKLLNPAYRGDQVRQPRRPASPDGVTAPRGGQGGISPVDFIQRMDAARRPSRRLRAPSVPRLSGRHPARGRMLVQDDHDGDARPAAQARRAGVPVRAHLADGVRLPDEPARRLRRHSMSSRRGSSARPRWKVYMAPKVDLLIHYLYRDEPDLGRWQSGLETTDGRVKPARAATMLPLAQLSRHGSRVRLWGQVRPGSGAQRYVIQRLSGLDAGRRSEARTSRTRRGSSRSPSSATAGAAPPLVPERPGRRARRFCVR